MSIQFNANALSAFSNVNFGQEDAIANLGEGNALVQNGNRGLGVFSKIRFSSTKANNNAVRTELLKSLAQAFGLQGVGEHDGRTTFSSEFMDRLEQILGPAFKRADFGIDANGVVKSGKPLTQRRIVAVCNAAKSYAANIKFQDVSALIAGSPIADIIGDNLTAAGKEGVKHLAVLAAKIRDAAQGLVNDGDGISVEHGNVAVNLTLENGRLTATASVGGAEARNVENFAKTKEELGQAMDRTLSALYDSFPGAALNDKPYGRDGLWDVVDYHEKSTSKDVLGSTNGCRLRDFTASILTTKAGVSEADIAKLTNDELATITKSFLRTGDADVVRNDAATLARRNTAFDDLSAFLAGGKIGEIAGDSRDAGWKEKVEEFATLAVEIKNAALKMDRRGESEPIVHDDFSVKLVWDGDGMKAKLNIDGTTRTVGNLGDSPEEVSKAMDDAIAALYDSPAERSVVSGSVLNSCIEQSNGKMNTVEPCPVRNFAGGLLKTKAGVTEEQLKMLTNSELANLVQKLCEKGDAKEISDAVESIRKSRFQDVSALLGGAKIAEIVADKNNPGWEAKVKNLALLAAKINLAAQHMQKKGDTAAVVHCGVKVELAWGDAGITAKTTAGGLTQSVENFAATPKDVCDAIDGTISALYDSFPEREFLNLTCGRSALREALNAYEKSASQDDLASNKDCRLRDFAGGILMAKAGATKAQIAMLTNGQLVAFVNDLCKSGDPNEVKDDIADASGIKDVPQPPKDNKKSLNLSPEAKTIAEFASIPENVKDTTNDCAFRGNARQILISKARVPDAHIAKLTNRELANFIETLMETNEPPSVRDAIAMTVEDR